MWHFAFPNRLIWYHENPDWIPTVEQLRSLDFILEALIEIDEPAIAVRRKKLIFPVGRFWAYLCTPEIYHVLKYGRIVEVRRIAAYTKAPLFMAYVRFFHDLKTRMEREGNMVFREMAKLMLNSLYGKFGQVENARSLVCEGLFDDGVQDFIDAETGDRGMLVTVQGKTWEISSTERPSFNSFPAIASMATAYGRMILWTIIKKAGLENVYYCDTDGVIVNQEGYENLSDLVKPHELGYLSIKKVSGELEVVNAKHYRMGGDLKIKGIRKDARRLDDFTFEQTQFLKTRGMWRRRLTDAAYSRVVIKRLTSAYDKGVVDADGHVHPFVLDESPSVGGCRSSTL
jgi:hypothetical protein